MDYFNKMRELGITRTISGKQICPQCSHTRKKKTDPCLSVSFTDEAILYNCHNCGWSGAIMKDIKTSKKVYKRPEQPKTVDDMEKVYKYFASRKISKETVDKYGIKYNGHEIVLPYYKNGVLVNTKYRTYDKRFRQEKDTEHTLFGMDLIKDIDTLIWVEGEMDVLALAEQGIMSVSIPDGADSCKEKDENKQDCIRNCFDFINGFENHIIAVDNDEKGKQLQADLLSRLKTKKCKVVDWGKYKDANEALIGGEDLKIYIDKAEYIVDTSGIVDYYDTTIFDKLYDYNFKKDTDYYLTGWSEIDDIIKVRTGYLMVVTGYPSRGKSTFVDNLLMILSKKYDFKHLIASFEVAPETHYNTWLEMYKEQSIENLKISQKDNFFDESYYFIADHFLRFDTDRMWTVDEIIEKTESAVLKYGIKTLTIDPYNRLKREIKEREDIYVGEILSKLAMLSKRLNILIIFVAHPKKPDKENSTMPTMYDISGSSDWYNMADYGIIVHRERNEQTRKLENFPKILVAKVKNFSLGNPSGGTVTLKYNLNKRILENE